MSEKKVACDVLTAAATRKTSREALMTPCTTMITTPVEISPSISATNPCKYTVRSCLRLT